MNSVFGAGRGLSLRRNCLPHDIWDLEALLEHSGYDEEDYLYCCGNDEHGKFWVEVAVSTILIIGTQVICEN